MVYTDVTVPMGGEHDPRCRTLQRKVARLLKDNVPSAQATIQNIEHEINSLDDMLVYTDSMKFEALPNGSDVVVSYEGWNGKLTRWSVGQLAKRMGITDTFARNLYDGDSWSVELLARILNDYARNTERKRVLVRAVDGTVRGVLAETYRRMNTPMMIEAVFDGGQEVGLLPWLANLGQTRITVRMIVPHIFKNTYSNHGDCYEVYGVELKTSDYADGGLDVCLTNMNCWCLNLHVFESLMRKVHVGKVLDDDIDYSTATYRIDSMRVASEVRDIVANMLTPQSMQQRLVRQQAAAEEVLDPEPVVKGLPKIGFSPGEIERLREALERNREAEVPPGPLTRFKLAQAMSFMSQGCESFTRSREIQQVAGKLMMDSKVITKHLVKGGK